MVVESLWVEGGMIVGCLWGSYWVEFLWVGGRVTFAGNGVGGGEALVDNGFVMGCGVIKTLL